MTIRLSPDQLYAFHSLDRDIFSKLVLILMRDPAESLLVVSLWLWLEEQGFPAMIPKLVSFPDPLVDTLTNEAVSCLKCLEVVEPDLSIGTLPLTSRVMNREINLRDLYEMKYSTICGIKSILNTTCNRAFADILQLVLGARTTNANALLSIPGFPHPVFGNVTVTTPSSNVVTAVQFPWMWDATGTVTEYDRTMFLTFSRGFPVSREEVKELFTSMFGEGCVEGVHMQDEGGEVGEQALFARLVLNSISTVDRILKGRRIAKFRINGKQIWARKYEPRRDHERRDQ